MSHVRLTPLHQLAYDHEAPVVSEDAEHARNLSRVALEIGDVELLGTCHCSLPFSTELSNLDFANVQWEGENGCHDRDACSPSNERGEHRQNGADIADSVQCHPDQIDSRLRQLDEEWDIERTLEANAATLAFTGIVLGALADRRWLAVPVVVTAFLFQHAVKGWCPPLPLLRAGGSERLGRLKPSGMPSRRYAATSVQLDPDPTTGTRKQATPSKRLGSRRTRWLMIPHILGGFSDDGIVVH